MEIENLCVPCPIFGKLVPSSFSDVHVPVCMCVCARVRARVCVNIGINILYVYKIDSISAWLTFLPPGKFVPLFEISLYATTIVTFLCMQPLKSIHCMFTKQMQHKCMASIFFCRESSFLWLQNVTVFQTGSRVAHDLRAVQAGKSCTLTLTDTRI